MSDWHGSLPAESSHSTQSIAEKESDNLTNTRELASMLTALDKAIEAEEAGEASAHFLEA